MQTQATMTREVVFVTPSMTLATAYRWMRHGKFRHLPVVAGGKLVGILSDRDVLIHATRKEDEIMVPHMTVGDAMTESPISVHRSTTVSRAAELMLEYKIDALPVVEAGNRLVGLVTSSDLLVLLIGENNTIAPRELPFTFMMKDLSLSAVA